MHATLLRPVPLLVLAAALLLNGSARADSEGFQMRTPGWARAVRATPERTPHFLVTPPVRVVAVRAPTVTANVGQAPLPFGSSSGQVPTVLQQSIAVNNGIQTVASGDGSTAITFIQVLQQQIDADAAAAAAQAALAEVLEGASVEP